MGLKLPLTLREEHRLRVFWRIFEAKDEMIGDWRKLLSEDLHNLYSSPSIIRMVKSGRMSWAGHVALDLRENGVVWTGVICLRIGTSGRPL
jgi:hypothetical protein